MKPSHTYGKWKIVKRKKEYSIYEGRKLIYSSESFNEAYELLDKYRKSV